MLSTANPPQHGTCAPVLGLMREPNSLSQIVLDIMKLIFHFLLFLPLFSPHHELLCYNILSFCLLPSYWPIIKQEEKGV